MNKYIVGLTGKIYCQVWTLVSTIFKMLFRSIEIVNALMNFYIHNIIVQKYKIWSVQLFDFIEIRSSSMERFKASQIVFFNG